LETAGDVGAGLHSRLLCLVEGAVRMDAQSCPSAAAPALASNPLAVTCLPITVGMRLPAPTSP